MLAACSSPPPPPPDNREAAYRENNRGVAELEQYAYDKAVESFRRAIALDDRVALPYLNLAIALFYAPNVEEADRAIAAADPKFPDSPRVAYMRGLIARAMNRPADAETAFKRVLALDPDDAAAMVNLGQLYLQDRRIEEAVQTLRAAVAREPANATARYALGQALIRSGAREEGARETRTFEALRDSGAGLTYSQAYLEQGHYAEALVSTGLEPDLIGAAPPAIRFVAGALSIGPGPIANSAAAQEASQGTRGASPVEGRGPGAVALTDLDQDGDLDLLVGRPQGLGVWRWQSGRFEDASRASGLPGSRPVRGIVAADLNNDERPDVVLLHDRGVSTWQQTPQAMFAAFPHQPATTMAPDTAALVDADHDGDLDLLIGGSGSPTTGALALLRNDGSGAFADVTAAAGIRAAGPISAVVAIDFDNRRDVDFVALSLAGPPSLNQNRRDGSFLDVAAQAGLEPLGSRIAITACDLNKDGFADFVAAGGATRAALAMSDGRGRFAIGDGPEGSETLTGVQCGDVDNDGLLDLVGAGPSGLRVFRNVGRRFENVSATVIGVERATQPILGFSLGDIDGDGDLDVAALDPAGPLLLRNDGGSAQPLVGVSLKARVSNRSGVGARVDVRAGSLWQRLDRLAVAPPVGPETPSIGLGDHATADAIRVLWPAGILQAETAISGSPITVVELDRKPSSCPFLYTWNGQSFEFITDFLGGGELGYWEAPGQYNHPDPDEFVRVTDRQLQPRDGRLELRITNELEEVLYLDRAQLISVDHPGDVEVYPREGMRANPARGLSLLAVRHPRAPASARSDRHDDLTALVSARDGRFTNGFTSRAIRGYADTHDLVFEFDADSSPSRSRALLLTGWTDYAFSSDNVAASQRGWTLAPPRLDVRDGDGSWRTLVADVGIPVGRPQTLVVEIGDAAKAGTRFRLRTNMRIHWDAIALAEVASDLHLEPQTHTLASAQLRWRGYSAIDDSRTPAPAIPDYQQLLYSSPWKVFAGRYTREGDVQPLVAAADDLFVVARTGDEIGVWFDAAPRPAGGRRTYLLGGVGFSKEMDLNSASPDVVLPLPARGLAHYPSMSPSPDTRARQRDMLDRYNTRSVARPWSQP